MKNICVNLIEFYQKFLSPDQGMFSSRRRWCVFYPSCSQYLKEAVSFGGIWYGVTKGILRILRCHPFQNNFYDPFRP
ncbi:MAG: membrane protein insertion efficiency factor YidD [bacterium]|nr:membrane protein insertion efficiency factor YidD [bacterium]